SSHPPTFKHLSRSKASSSNANSRPIRHGYFRPGILGESNAHTSKNCAHPTANFYITGNSYCLAATAMILDASLSQVQGTWIDAGGHHSAHLTSWPSSKADTRALHYGRKGI